MVGSPDELFPKSLRFASSWLRRTASFTAAASASALSKALNNYLSCLTALATAETFNIGVRAGLNAQSLLKVINASSDMSFNSKVNNPVPGLTRTTPRATGTAGVSRLNCAQDDMELGVKAGDDLDAMMPLGKPMQCLQRGCCAGEVKGYSFQGNL